MRYLKIFSVALAAIILSACAAVKNGHSKDYVKEGRMVHPLVIPPTANAPKQKSFYQVPNAPAGYNANAQSVSLVPPGSQLPPSQASAKKMPAPAASTKMYAKKSASDLVIKKASAGKVWTKAGRALRSAHYQILDQDNALGTYYVLDTQQTNNKITRKTPIYRLKIQQVGKNTQLSVLNQNNSQADPKVSQRILNTVAKGLG